MTSESTGTVLRRAATVQGFAALEVDGKSLAQAAASLRALIQKKIGADAAQCLALAQVDDSGKRYDWFAPFEGNVKPWVAASEAECSSALAQLEGVRRQLAGLAQSLEADGQAEGQTQAALLRKVLYFPGSDCVYLVDGKPVIIFWGFAVAGSDTLDPLRYLRQLPAGSLSALASDLVPPAPVVEEPVEAPEPAPLPPAPSGWRWLGWLLLLLLLLAVLFLGLRTFVPQVKLPWGLGEIDLPWLVVEAEPAPEPEPQVPVEEEPEEEELEEEEPEPVVQEPEPEPHVELSIELLNGHWVADFQITKKDTEAPAGHLEYLMRDGQGMVYHVGNNRESLGYASVTASVQAVPLDSEMVNLFKISNARILYRSSEPFVTPEILCISTSLEKDRLQDQFPCAFSGEDKKINSIVIFLKAGDSNFSLNRKTN